MSAHLSPSPSATQESRTGRAPVSDNLNNYITNQRTKLLALRRHCVEEKARVEQEISTILELQKLRREGLREDEHHNEQPYHRP